MKRTYQKKFRTKEINKAHGMLLAQLASKFIYECTGKKDEEIREIYGKYKSAWETHAKESSDLKKGIIVNPDQFDEHISEFYNKLSTMQETHQVKEYKRISNAALEKSRVLHLAKFIKNSLKNPDKKIG